MTTPQFAVDCIANWWKNEGQWLYPEASELVILADAGGGNSYRAWKCFLQHNFANRFDLAIAVAHCPSGTSKWNPIEHRLHSEVSKHRAGVPLQSFDLMLRYLRTDTTVTGLTVSASRVETVYEKGIKITDQQMKMLDCVRADAIPKWNYTIKPAPDCAAAALDAHQN